MWWLGGLRCINTIKSRENQLYKHIMLLTVKKGRERYGEFIVEGAKFVQEALIFCNVKVVAMSESYFAKNKKQVEVYSDKAAVFSETLFNQMATTVNTGGVLAVCEKLVYNNEEVLHSTKPGKLFLLAEDMQDPGNLGATIRVADAAGADAVLLSPFCAELYNPKVLRGAAGSVFHIPVLENMDMEKTVGELKASGVRIYAAHLSGALYPYNLELRQSLAIIIGSEADGLKRETAALADALVKLPMYGMAESLNASVAAGVLLYEVVRQRL